MRNIFYVRRSRTYGPQYSAIDKDPMQSRHSRLKADEYKKTIELIEGDILLNKNEIDYLINGLNKIINGSMFTPESEAEALKTFLKEKMNENGI